MTRATTATLAVAADYADAMMAARRGKNWLFLLLLVLLLLQLAIFFVAHFVPTVQITANVATSTRRDDSTTQSTDIPIVQHASETGSGWKPADFPAAGISHRWQRLSWHDAVIVLAITLLLIVTIMLVGRLVGVAHVTSAFLWCVFLMVMLFPWQTLLNGQGKWVRLTRDIKGIQGRRRSSG